MTTITLATRLDELVEKVNHKVMPLQKQPSTITAQNQNISDLNSANGSTPAHFEAPIC